MSADAMLCTLFGLVLAVSSLLQTAAAGDIKLKRIVPAEQLKCYFCFEIDTACIDMSNVTTLHQQECRLHEPFCKTERITTDGKLTAFARQCAPDCKGGCMWVGDISRCIECCTYSMCNVGLAASKSTPTCSAREHHVILTLGLVVLATTLFKT